jgi:hypothetical protein
VLLQPLPTQTPYRIWLDLAEHPGEGATAAQIAARSAIPLRSVNRVLKDKLVPNRLVVASESRPSKGRPSVAYRLNLDGPLLDEIAESFGLLDWQERTAERYEREREGYREVQRQRLDSWSLPVATTVPAGLFSWPYAGSR